MGKSSKVTIGHKIFLGMQHVLCRGPVDFIRRIRADEKTFWSGRSAAGRLTVNEPELFGGDREEGGISGELDIEFGEPTQGRNDYLETAIGEDISAYRGVVQGVLRQMYLGATRYIKRWEYRLQRIHVRQDGIDQWYDETSEIREVEVDSTVLLVTNFDGGLADDLSCNPKPYAYKDASNQGTLADGTYTMPIKEEATGNEDGLYYSGGSAWGGLATCTVEFLFDLQSQPATFVSIFNIDTGVLTDEGGMNIHQSSGFIRQKVGTGDVQFGKARSPGQVNHIAYVWDGNSSTCRVYFNGNYAATLTGRSIHNSECLLGGYNNTGGLFPTNTVIFHGVKITKAAVYTGTGAYTEPTSFSVPVCYTGCPGMNPAHIIRECLTDPDWGMGYPESDIDDSSFRDAALALYNEELGLSLEWQRKKKIEDFINDVKEHIDAALYPSRTTGKLVLKLIRDDYNETGLTVLDENSVVAVSDYKKSVFGELVNTVVVNYENCDTAKPDSVAARDVALIQQQGAVIEAEVQYPGVRWHDLAARLAERDLRALSTPLVSCSLIAKREAANINPGDAFILDWPDYDIDMLVMRCNEISYGTGKTNAVKIKCTQDVFSTPSVGVVAEDTSAATGLDSTAQNATPQAAMEVPYYLLARELGDRYLADILADNPVVGFAMAVGGRPTSAHITADLYLDDGGGYDLESVLDFCPWGALAAEQASYDAGSAYELPPASSFIVLDGDNVKDLTAVTVPALALMGDEWVRVASLEQNSAGDWECVVGRGCLDTTPQPHTADSSGQYLYFCGDLFGSSTKEFVSGEEISAKIKTHTLTGALALADADVLPVMFHHRAIRPYPPGDLRLNGESYPVDVVADSGDDVLVSWAHRDRTLQTGDTIYDHSFGDIGPETNTTYTVRLYDHSDTLVSEQTGLTGNSASVDLAALIDASARIDVVAVRDGYESWQAASHRFEWNFVDSGTSQPDFEEFYVTGDGQFVANGDDFNVSTT